MFDGELSDKDQVVARANNNVQLLQTDNANPTRAGTWKVLAPAVPGAFNDITVTNSHFTNIGTNVSFRQSCVIKQLCFRPGAIRLALCGIGERNGSFQGFPVVPWHPLGLRLHFLSMALLILRVK